MNGYQPGHDEITLRWDEGQGKYLLDINQVRWVGAVGADEGKSLVVGGGWAPLAVGRKKRMALSIGDLPDLLRGGLPNMAGWNGWMEVVVEALQRCK